MHGRPRRAPTSEDAAASEAKASRLRSLQAQVLNNHHNRIYTKEALDSSLKLLEINPEVLYGWNYRKLALQHNLREATDDDAIRSLLDEELRAVEIALRRNPKSYGAWHHRKWVLGKQLSKPDFDKEFRLVNQLLKVDPRNFHGWNYHRFIAAMKGVPEVEELQFTIDKIDENFSNYSAWHNRSMLLSHLLKQKAQGYVSREDILTEEYNLVHQALFTDPTDQSGWFYHLWLLDQTVTADLLLVSSWPVNGSDWVLSVNGLTGDQKLFSSTNPKSYYSLHSGAFPIVLYFNQAVKGVNSSTITVNSTFVENEDIIWRPISSSSSGEGHCWVTNLRIPDLKPSSLNTYTVEVSLHHSHGITSSRGFNYSYPLQLKFNINLTNIEPEQSEQKLDQDLLIWGDDNVLLEENPAVITFVPLKNNVTNVSEHSKWQLETLSNELTLFKEMPEENSKFLMLTLARIYNAYDAMASHGTALMQKRIQSGEVLKLFVDLMKLDPSHKGYYEDERSSVTIDQVTSDRESLMKYCRCLNTLDPPNFHHHLCLRLNRLSLTRISFVERLLWVQILDLSHNKLRSIEGLEALQLLTSLNLSHNRICSFTALEPLKLMASLRALNISFNEIGAHSVDTTRYLLRSPLSSHMKDIVADVGVYEEDGIKLADHWEAILLFRDLRLTQLVIEGNTAAGMKAVLSKVVPTLRWLDGECIS